HSSCIVCPDEDPGLLIPLGVETRDGGASLRAGLERACTGFQSVSEHPVWALPADPNAALSSVRVGAGKAGSLVLRAARREEAEEQHRNV
ncbi:hypothetical protein NDU88_002960, partial [Pleurodeles waltl]